MATGGRPRRSPGSGRGSLPRRQRLNHTLERLVVPAGRRAAALPVVAVALSVLLTSAGGGAQPVPTQHYTLQPGDACDYHAMCESDACWGGYCCVSNQWCSSGQCTPSDWGSVNVSAPYIAEGASDWHYLLSFRETSPFAGACVPTPEDEAWRDACMAVGEGCLQCVCEPRDPVIVDDPEDRADPSFVRLRMVEEFDGTAVCHGRLDGPCVFVTGANTPGVAEGGFCVPDLMARRHGAVPDEQSPFAYLADWPGFDSSIQDGIATRWRYVRPTMLNAEYQPWQGLRDPGLIEQWGEECPDAPMLANWPLIGLAGAWVLWALLWPVWYIARTCRQRRMFTKHKKSILAWYEDVARWTIEGPMEELLWHGHYMEGHEFRLGVWAYIRPLCWFSLASLPALVQAGLMTNEIFGPVGDDQRFGPLTFFPGVFSIVAYAAMLSSLFTDNKRGNSQVYVLTNECAVIVKVDWRTRETGAVRRYFFTDMPDLELIGRNVVFKNEVKHIRKHPRGFREVQLPVGFIDIRQAPAVYEMLITMMAEELARTFVQSIILDEVAEEGARAAAACEITQEAEYLEDRQTEWDFEETVFQAQREADPAWVELAYVDPALLTTLAQPQLHKPAEVHRKRMQWM